MASASSYSLSSGRTGDLKNNMIKLLRELERMKLSVEPNIKSLSQGVPSAFLPLLHAALMDYSLPLAKHIASMEIDLYSKNDLKFVDGLYKVMRDVFEYRPQLSRDKFLSDGFAERKIILSCDVLHHCQRMHLKLTGTSKNPRPLTRGPRNKLITSTSVHTLSDSAGIGNYWQEKQSSLVTLSRREDYIPPSPPQTPSLSPSIGLQLLTDPSLDITPLQTPLKYQPLAPLAARKEETQPREESDITGPVKEKEQELQLRGSVQPNLITSTSSNEEAPLPVIIKEGPQLMETPLTGCEPLDKENVIPQYNCGSEKRTKIYKDRPLMESNVDISSEHNSRSGALLNESLPKSMSTASVDVNLMLDKMTHLSETVHTLSARLVLLETQLKIKDTKTTSVCHIGTQTEDQHHPILSQETETLLDPTLSPVSTPTLSPSPTNFTSSHSSSRLLPVAATSPHSTSDSLLATAPQTPEDTRQLIQSLRARARSTKELLHKTGHAASHDDSI
ncbi:PREDICTED: centrosomal protein of 44 kDa-like [Amphimedon queenslandica]|uniref:Centrosomal protein of 44 kDa n=2 Tax=Amphimedon queenslandica TaxID=400682 RepID=A0AAN0JH20_AMPQE|nr:PREDICTED: centrosomal protein of 44 kDa-like [Amphimedon queenslandica]|eukprot:XP_019856325.1 PREDICTED: centrosomal protein of 44 kDa-like [Amphimedon queenslandica]